MTIHISNSNGALFLIVISATGLPPFIVNQNGPPLFSNCDQLCIFDIDPAASINAKSNVPDSSKTLSVSQPVQLQMKFYARHRQLSNISDRCLSMFQDITGDEFPSSGRDCTTQGTISVKVPTSMAFGR